MTIRECYEEIGADYAEVVSRLGTESMVKRFVMKFPDEPSFPTLTQALGQQDGETAFRMAHTLKGVCLNLGFTKLYEASAELTEKLRGRETAGSEELFFAVQEEYTRVVQIIRRMITEETA